MQNLGILKAAGCTTGIVTKQCELRGRDASAAAVKRGAAGSTFYAAEATPARGAPLPTLAPAEGRAMCSRVLPDRWRMEQQMHYGELFALDKGAAADAEGGGGGGGKKVKLACVVEPFLNSYCHGVGIVPFLREAVLIAHFCESLGAVPTINWRACPDEFCPTATGANFWNSYFEPVNEGVAAVAEQTLCVGGSQAIAMALVPRFAAGFGGAEPEGEVLRRLVKLGPETQAVVDKAAARLAGHRVLAVHVRGTDKRESFNAAGAMVTYCEKDPTTGKSINCASSAGEPPLSLGDWVRAAEKEWKAMGGGVPGGKPVKLFVASDSWESVRTFAWYFGAENVVYADAVRNEGYASQCCSRMGQGAASTIAQGRGALTDIWLLAKGDKMLHTGSSWPQLIEMLNPKLARGASSVVNVYKTGKRPDDIALWNAKAKELGTARPGAKALTQAQKEAYQKLTSEATTRKYARLDKESEPRKAFQKKCFGELGAAAQAAGKAPLSREHEDYVDTDEDMVCLLKNAALSQCSGMRSGRIFGFRAPWMEARMKAHGHGVVSKATEAANRCEVEIGNRNCKESTMEAQSEDQQVKACNACAQRYWKFLEAVGCTKAKTQESCSSGFT
jgi:hypothetical protein